MYSHVHTLTSRGPGVKALALVVLELHAQNLQGGRTGWTPREQLQGGVCRQDPLLPRGPQSFLLRLRLMRWGPHTLRMAICCPQSTNFKASHIEIMPYQHYLEPCLTTSRGTTF